VKNASTKTLRISNYENEEIEILIFKLYIIIYNRRNIRVDRYFKLNCI